MCAPSIKLYSITTSPFKVVLTGEGSKILNNNYKDEFFIVQNLDFLEEKIQDVCRAGFKLSMGLNTQEVTIVPKKLIKQGFFERFFHFFN